MARIECPGCARQMEATASFCTHCRHTLEVALVNVAAYSADLTTLRTGQARYSTGGSRSTGSSGSPLGMNALFERDGKGTQLMHETRNALVTWSRYVTEHNEPVTGPVCHPLACLHVSCNEIRKRRPPVNTTESITGYLISWSDWLRVTPAGPQMLEEMLDLEKRLRRMVDRPADRWFAGICSAVVGEHNGETCSCSCHNAPGTPCSKAGGCGTTWTVEAAKCEAPLHAPAREGDVTCPACGATWDVAGRRKIMLDQAEETLATASEASRAVIFLGEFQTTERRLVDRLGHWVKRARLMTQGEVPEWGRMRPLYRIGDIVDLLLDDERRADERRQRRKPDRVA